MYGDLNKMHRLPKWSDATPAIVIFDLTNAA
jgi:hypothetical protein